MEVRRAELRLAQARRIPNIALGPRYKRDAHQNIVGGEIAIPLPFFNRNQDEITTALAHQKISEAELEGRVLGARQQLETTYKKLAVARENFRNYGSNYLEQQGRMLALSRRAYEAGEMSILNSALRATG